jgi:phosphoglycerol transferase MdoB-like AlkP superfamily enzyme
MAASSDSMNRAPQHHLTVKVWIVLVWGSFVLLQFVQRALLLLATWDREPATAETLLTTLIIGGRGDLMAATYVLAIAAIMASLYGGVRVGLRGRGGKPGFVSAWLQGFKWGAAVCGGLLLIVLLIDFGYYHFNQQRLNFVFFEYLGDLIGGSQPSVDPDGSTQSSTQSIGQTSAELQQFGKWAGPVGGFFLAQLIVLTGWWRLVTRYIGSRLVAHDLRRPRMMLVVFLLSLSGGAMGFHSKGPYAIRVAAINSLTYYTLAQNPLLYASEGLRATLDSQFRETSIPGFKSMSFDEAVRRVRSTIGSGASFPSAQYPLVHKVTRSPVLTGTGSPRRVNVLLIFIEGLDRRFLGSVRQGVAVTPFLDRLKKESVYFEHFFSNGVQTSRGLLATLCSTFPRDGAAAMKTRYAHDYPCAPEWLRRAGYRTEMVISQHRDLNRLQLFVSRNGLQHLYDESDFPAGAMRLGLGYSDGALFDFIHDRVAALQALDRPFFLATLTLATHHPFAYLNDDEAIRTLSGEADGYVPALRYTDREFERVFTRLQREGLFRDTVVVMLGDHGRHEAVGATEIEKQVGHFMAPLMIWCDKSLRVRRECRPGTISAIASQVDVAPTVLGLAGVAPPITGFMGRDLSCEMTGECLRSGWAFLSSVYDDLSGWVDEKGILVYSFRTEKLLAVDMDVRQSPVQVKSDAPDIRERFENLMAFHVASNMLLDQNRLWSWTEWGGRM